MHTELKVSPGAGLLRRQRRQLLGWVAIGALSASPAAWAHQGAAHAKSKPNASLPPEQKPWGIAGNKADARRTLNVRMTDAMRFSPDIWRVNQNETVRIVVHNDGKMLHELVIGTRDELDRHAEQMIKHPNMEHDEPYMAHVAPGARGEIIWRFNRAGEFHFACLIAGHYQAGMVGRISVLAR